MKKITTIIAVAICFFFISFLVIFLNFESPQVKTITLTNGDLKSESNQVFATLTLDNDNWFSINGRDIVCMLNYKGKEIAKSSSIESNHFSKGQQQLVCDLTLYIDSLMAVDKGILDVDSIQVDLNLKGKYTFARLQAVNNAKIWIKTEIFKDRIFQKEAKNNAFELKKIAFKEASIFEIKLNADFELKNKSNLDFNLESIACALYSDDNSNKAIANWKSNQKGTIKKNTAKTFNGQFIINNFNAVYNGFDNLSNAKFDYYLIGTASLSYRNKIHEIPLKQKIPYSLIMGEIPSL